jgi:16S rRNA (uracil1498-N3)-methyltransferase
MNLFYQPDIRVLELDEEESRHCMKVLRLRTGDIINVTDGMGLHQKCKIVVGNKKVTYQVQEANQVPRRRFSIRMAVAPTRKAERNEWMVEKMTEIGVETIDFVVTENTNRESVSRVVNLPRLRRIAGSAMKQSQQFYLPEIRFFDRFGNWIAMHTEGAKLIAYVPENFTSAHVYDRALGRDKATLLVGPEGDFSPEEIELALANGYETVSLGPNRLRTETAAVAGCHAVNLAFAKQIDKI